MSSLSSDPTTLGSWQWAACGASVTGSQHLHRGAGCDDAFAYSLADDFVVAVVADGAGSVSGTSAWGSYTACQSVLKRATNPQFISSFRAASPSDADDIVRWLFSGALERITRQADELNLSLAQLSTTLCVAVATPQLAVFGQIGDGIIAAETDGKIATHLIEEKDEYANTTWFLQTRGAFEEALRMSVHTGLTAFALSTDGMAYKITNVVTGEAYEPFFTGSWQHVRSGADAADFAALLRDIQEDQTGDDKTMVLAVLHRVDDRFHPSARPVTTTTVHSPPPPLVADLPRPAEPQPASPPPLAAEPPLVVHNKTNQTAPATVERETRNRIRNPLRRQRIVDNGELVIDPNADGHDNRRTRPADPADNYTPLTPAGQQTHIAEDTRDDDKRRFRPRRPRRPRQ